MYFGQLLSPISPIFEGLVAPEGCEVTPKNELCMHKVVWIKVARVATPGLQQWSEQTVGASQTSKELDKLLLQALHQYAG